MVHLMLCASTRPSFTISQTSNSPDRGWILPTRRAEMLDGSAGFPGASYTPDSDLRVHLAAAGLLDGFEGGMGLTRVDGNGASGQFAVIGSVQVHERKRLCRLRMQ